MKNLRENSPNFSYSRLNTCGCCNKTTFCWLIFSPRKEANNLKVWVFNWIRNHVWRYVQQQAVETMYRKVKKVKKIRSLLQASLSLHKFLIAGSCVKRVWGSQQVGESLPCSQLSRATVRRKRVNHEPVWSGRMCLFVEGDQHLIKFWHIASKNNTTALQRLLQVLKVGTVYKCGFRVGVEIGLKYMSKIYCLWRWTVCK